MTDTSSEQHRVECEARFVWRECGGNALRIRNWLDKLERRRGPGSIDELRALLRERYKQERGKA